MIKKVSLALTFSIILITILFLVNMKYHFMFKSVCGSGLAGLKILGIYMAVVTAVFLLWKLNGKREKSIRCISCKASIEDSWEICPYCGYENSERKSHEYHKGGSTMKKWFKNFLKKLEEANKKNFGSQRLDCCDVNKKSNQKK